MLNGTTPSRTVWTADLDYWITGREQKMTSDPAWRTEEGFLELCGELRVMPYHCYPRFWLARPRFDPAVKVSTERRGNATRTVWKTPAGELAEEQAWQPVSSFMACTKYAIGTSDDLRVLLDLMERRWLEPVNLDDYPIASGDGGDAGGLPSIALPRSPLSAFVYEWAGLQHGIYLLADHPGKSA